MFTINFKGKQNPKDKNLVKIDMILFKSGYPRVSKLINLTGPFKNWDQSKQCFVGKNSDNMSTNTKLAEIKMKYLKAAEEWEAEGKKWSPVQWSHRFESVRARKEDAKVIPVITMINNIIVRSGQKERIKNGHVVTGVSTGKQYMVLKNHLTQFTKEKYNKAFSTYYFEDITEHFLQDFLFYLQKNALKKGTEGGISTYLRKFFGVLHYAGEAGIPDVNIKIFDSVRLQMWNKQYTPKTLPYDVFQKIENIDRSSFTRTECLHIDLFLMSFYCGGIAPIDLCYLTWNCIKEGVLTYERMKVPKKASLPFINKAEAIVHKYENKCYGDYVMPVFNHKQKEEWQKRGKVDRTIRSVNITLRKVRKLIKHPSKITWYAARGTFITKMVSNGYNVASVAKYAGNSIVAIDKNYYKETNMEDVRSDMNLRL